jgi:hypothetical protein
MFDISSDWTGNFPFLNRRDFSFCGQLFMEGCYGHRVEWEDDEKEASCL